MSIPNIFFFLARTSEESLSFLLLLPFLLLLLDIFTSPTIQDISFSKFEIPSSSESLFPSSKSTPSMLTLLVPGSISLSPSTLDDRAHVYSLVAIILEYILSNLNFKDGSIPAYLIFLAYLISYIKEIKIINATSYIKFFYEI